MRRTPYIVTTKRPTGRLRLLDGSSEMGVFSRVAVATLEEARGAARAEWRRFDHPDGRDMNQRVRFLDAVKALPDSGGTITLPDGTVIEVEQTTWRELLPDWITEDGFALVHQGNTEAQQRILDAFNAQGAKR